MLAALLKTAPDLLDPQLRPILLAVVAWSVGLLALAAALAFVLLGWAAAGLAFLPAWLSDGLALAPAAFAAAALAWLALALDVAGVPWLQEWFAVAAPVWLACAAVAQAVASFHLDAAIAGVERRHYPQLAPPRPRAAHAMTREAAAALRFPGLLLALNAALLPFYLVGLVLPPLAIAAFCAANGWLFGREYADAVLLRRLPPGKAAAWRRARRGRLWLAGAAIAFAMTLPVLNLLGPIAAAIFMTHVCHGSARQG